MKPWIDFRASSRPQQALVSFTVRQFSMIRFTWPGTRFTSALGDQLPNFLKPISKHGRVTVCRGGTISSSHCQLIIWKMCRQRICMQWDWCDPLCWPWMRTVHSISCLFLKASFASHWYCCVVMYGRCKNSKGITGTTPPGGAVVKKR